MQRSITDAMTQFADKNKLREFGTELGRPALHADIQDECHGAAHLCSHEDKPVIPNAGHHVRAKTNQPIYGILT